MSNSRNDIEEASEGTGWMATYSDMVTLLMTFFVLLFAISNIDAQKFALLAAGLSRDGITAEQFIEIQEKYGMDGVGLPDPDDIQYPAPDDDPSMTEGEQGGDGELARLHELLQEYIKNHSLDESISVTFSGDKVLLTLSNDIWFRSGSADITPEMRERAAELARLLTETHNDNAPYEIITVGHTDNRPISTSRYPSNWHLSVDRAVNFLDVLIQESGLMPNFFSARGCGEVIPIADNDTDEGRQLNRRVEVLVSQPKDMQ